MTEVDLFGVPIVYPIPAQPAAETVRKLSLSGQIEERFKANRFGSYTLTEVAEMFPTHKREVIAKAMGRLLKDRTIKAMPQGHDLFGAPLPLRYTITLYK